MAMPVTQQPSVEEALDRIDPVLLVQGKEIQGKPDLRSSTGLFSYWPPETKASIETPRVTRSSCTASVRGWAGRLGSPGDYAVVDGKLHLGSDECHEVRQATPAKYLAAPAPPLDGSGKPSAKAGALLWSSRVGCRSAAPPRSTPSPRTSGEHDPGAERAARALCRSRQRPCGASPPGDARLERTADPCRVRGDRSATLITPGGGVVARRARAHVPSDPGARVIAEHALDYSRQLVPLLHGRRIARSRPPRSGSASWTGMTVESRAGRRTARSTSRSGIDPSSGRIRPSRVHGSNMITPRSARTRSSSADYRPVPPASSCRFRSVRALFDGAPDGYRLGAASTPSGRSSARSGTLPAWSAEAK